MYDLSIPAQSMTPELRDFVGSGSCFILNEGQGLLPQMNSGGRCKVYAALKRPIDWVDKHSLPDGEKRKWIAELFRGWCDGFAEKLIMAAEEDSVVARRIYGFQPDLKWESGLTGVTVIGKRLLLLYPGCKLIFQATRHTLCPHQGKVSIKVCRAEFFAIQCSSSGLADAMYLSRALISALNETAASSKHVDHEKLRTTLRTFEEEMMDRVKEEMGVSYDMTERFYAPDAARGFAEFFKEMAGGE
jgi:hypothetical protein